MILTHESFSEQLRRPVFWAMGSQLLWYSSFPTSSPKFGKHFDLDGTVCNETVWNLQAWIEAMYIMNSILCHSLPFSATLSITLGTMRIWHGPWGDGMPLVVPNKPAAWVYQLRWSRWWGVHNFAIACHSSPRGPSFEPWRQGSEWIRWWWNVWWNVYTLGHLVAVMAVIPSMAASFLLLPPRMLVKWPFQLQLLVWLKCWAQMLGQQQPLARYGQIMPDQGTNILSYSRYLGNSKTFRKRKKYVLSMSKVAWFARFPHVPHSPFVSIDWQCSSRLSACWATAARSVKPGRTQPNVVRPASSEMCSIDRSIISFSNLHIYIYF